MNFSEFDSRRGDIQIFDVFEGQKKTSVRRAAQLHGGFFVKKCRSVEKMNASVRNGRSDYYILGGTSTPARRRLLQRNFLEIEVAPFPTKSPSRQK